MHDPIPTTEQKTDMELPEPFGYVMHWPAPGGGDELVFSRTDAAGKAIGCAIRPVWVDHQMRAFAVIPHPDTERERTARQEAQAEVAALKERIAQLRVELRREDAKRIEELEADIRKHRVLKESLEAERDAAFAMSRCECQAAEACANLVAANAARDDALARVAELERENRILHAKTRGTLANNLCPDHRDKQVGKSCLACTIETLTRERDAALAQLAEARKDSDRLDFLEADAEPFERHDPMRHAGEWWVTRYTDSQVFGGSTLRDAIDFAKADVAHTKEEGERGA